MPRKLVVKTVGCNNADNTQDVAKVIKGDGGSETSPSLFVGRCLGWDLVVVQTRTKTY